MDTVPLPDCRPFLEFYGPRLLDEGLVTPLAAFSRAHPGPLGRWALSLHDALVSGNSFQDALAGASPVLPPEITDLLRIGFENANLDRVVFDMAAAAAEADSAGDLARRLNAIRKTHAEASGPGDPICRGCLENEFRKILLRAELEEAREVILTQEDERFFHQTHVGPKPVHVREPGHSRTWRTLLRALDAAADGGDAMAAPGGPCRIERLGPGRFLVQAKRKVILDFPGARGRPAGGATPQTNR